MDSLGDRINIFAAGYCSAVCLVNLGKGDYGWATVMLMLVVVNIVVAIIL